MQASTLTHRGFRMTSGHQRLPDGDMLPAIEHAGNSTVGSAADSASIAAIFSRPRNDAPWWVLPILTFFAGLSIPLAMLMTVNATPDHQRGISEGIAIGMKMAVERSSTQERALYLAGVNAGRHAERNGLPDPVPPSVR